MSRGTGSPSSSARRSAHPAPPISPRCTTCINTKTATAAAVAVVAAVIVFVLINWALVLVPFASLEFRPQGTEKALKRFMDWLTGHERQIAAGVALLAGGYMVISGLVRALS